VCMYVCVCVCVCVCERAHRKYERSRVMHMWWRRHTYECELQSERASEEQEAEEEARIEISRAYTRW